MHTIDKTDRRRLYIRLAHLLIPIATLLVAEQLRSQGFEFTLVYSSTIMTGDYAGDIDIVECRINSMGVASQPLDSPRTISAQSIREFDPVATEFCPSEYVVAYTVERGENGGTDRDIYARRIDSNGANVWDVGGSPIVPIAQSRIIEEHPAVLGLGDGSVLIAYEVRYGPDPWSDVDIAVTQIGPEGAQVRPAFWAVKSKRVERIASLVANGAGGAYLVINSATYRDSSLVNSDIVLQRIATDGVIGWKDSPEPVTVASSKHIERNASAVPDGSRGVYVAYELEYIGEGRDGEVDILAQRVGEYGRRMWIDDKALPVVSSSLGANETAPTLTNVGNGIVVAFDFASAPSKGSGLSAIGLQRLDSNGRSVWNDGRRSKLLGVAHAQASRPAMAPDFRGGVWLAFEALDTATGNIDVALQHVSNDGEELLGDGAGALPLFSSEERESSAVIVSDPSGAATAFALRTPLSTGKTTYSAVVASRISFEGDAQWTDNPHIVVATPTVKSKPVIMRCER